MIEITKDTKITLTVEQLSYLGAGGIPFWKEAQSFSITTHDGKEVITDAMRVVVVYSRPGSRKVTLQGLYTSMLAFQAKNQPHLLIFSSYADLLMWVSTHEVLASKAEIAEGKLIQIAEDYLHEKKHERVRIRDTTHA